MYLPPGPPPPPGPITGATDILDWTREDLLEHGRRLDARYERDGMMDGRPLTNYEMFAMVQYRRHLQTLERETGCDCEGPESNGQCRKQPGRCPFFVAALRIIWGDEHEH